MGWDKDETIVMIVIFLIGFAVGGAMWGNIDSRCWEASAIEAGAGEWTIDPKTGAKYWLWTPRQSPE